MCQPQLTHTTTTLLYSATHKSFFLFFLLLSADPVIPISRPNDHAHTTHTTHLTAPAAAADYTLKHLVYTPAIDQCLYPFKWLLTTLICAKQCAHLSQPLSLS